MGKRGPKPTPTAILENRGSWRATGRADAGSRSQSTLPDCPTWLPDAARQHWPEIGQWLVGWGVMLDRYTPSVAALCLTLAQFIQVAKQVESEPLTVPSSGGPKTNPVWTEFDRAYKRLMDALSRHGLTPSAAAGISVTKEEKDEGLNGLRLADSA